MDGRDERYEREQRFHDVTFAGDMRARARKFYAVTTVSADGYAAALSGIPAGSHVLEYGCGKGSLAFELAERGVRVTGIDISAVGIQTARDEAASQGLEGLEFLQMNAENLDFEASSFDAVCGSGILHHLDLGNAWAQIARVLKPGGRAVFYEPLGHNPMINWYRRRTPSMRTADEHPLLVQDIVLARSHFTAVRFRTYHLFVLLAVPLQGTPFMPMVKRALDALDRVALLVPGVRRLGWIAVIECHGPRTTSA